MNTVLRFPSVILELKRKDNNVTHCASEQIKNSVSE